MRTLFIYGILLLSLGCGSSSPSAPSDANNPPVTASSGDVFPQELFVQFPSWETVMPQDQAFISQGHGGIWVRAYFNKLAAPVYKGNQAFPFPEGSIIAKAAVGDSSQPTQNAATVYFLRKMDNSYDPQNNNWAYGMAKKVNGQYQIVDSGKIQMCISCHSRGSDMDYVSTVKIYRDSHRLTSLGSTPTPWVNGLEE